MKKDLMELLGDILKCVSAIFVTLTWIVVGATTLITFLANFIGKPIKGDLIMVMVCLLVAICITILHRKMVSE